MGCWDIFCFLCGNTCHSCNNLHETLLYNIEFYESIMNSKNKKHKWFINYFLDIYENYKKDPSIFQEKINKIYKSTKWLNNCTFLSANGSINHNCKEIDCNTTFVNKKGKYFLNQQLFENTDIDYGLFLHTDCWKFIEKEYKIKLSYKYLPINKISIYERKNFNFINYGKIENYWQQDFDFIKIISDNNEELCISPLKSKLVANNIKKIFNKFKIRKDEKRKSPIISASFYKEDIYRIGNNGNIWFIKNGKWNELKNVIHMEMEIKNINKIKNKSYMEDINIQPIFILNIDKKNIKILTTTYYQNKLL